MKAWLALVKKEFRVGMPIFLLTMILFIIGTAAMAALGYKVNHIGQPIGIFGLVWGAGLSFFLAIYMLFSLSIERKRMHLWLHNPMHASGLLLAKLLTGTVYLLVSLLAASFAAYFGGLEFIGFTISEASWLKIGIILFIHVVLFSLDFVVYVILAYVLFLLMERYMHAFLSGIIVFFGFWIFNGLYFGLFQMSKFYETISYWGKIDLESVASGLNFEASITEMAIYFQQDVPIYAGMYVLETVVVILLFFIASWLLDKKVEV
ncbi:hypothetical protein SFC66_15060 [Terribacillus saccharophilus]|uniref:hypothetical protein n=1 Tax=Terribacillus saccharophilus TaxID=361277 RepID=UPI003982399F